MVLDLVTIALVILVISLVPVLMMAGLFALVDYLADDEKLEEVRKARREGRTVDFSGTRGSPGAETDAGGSGVRRDVDSDGGHADPSASIRASSSSSPIAPCPDCGVDNETVFGRCWNCQSKL